MFLKSSPPAPRQLTQVTNQGELINGRIHRWFGTVVSARLLVAGVRRRRPRLDRCLLAESPLNLCVSPPPFPPQVTQILAAAACLLATVTHACVSYGCSLAVFTPVWSSISVSPTSDPTPQQVLI